MHESASHPLWQRSVMNGILCQKVHTYMQKFPWDLPFHLKKITVSITQLINHISNCKAITY